MPDNLNRGSLKSKETLKSFFENGDIPTEDHFADLIESFSHLSDPENIKSIVKAPGGNIIITLGDDTIIEIKAKPDLAADSEKLGGQSSSAYLQKSGGVITGNLGVGTSGIPAAKLEVKGPFESNTSQFVINTTNSHAELRFSANDVNKGFIWFNTSEDKMAFGRGSAANSQFIDSGGNFGFGTNSPQQKMHIKGGMMRLETSNGFADIGSNHINQFNFDTDRNVFLFNKTILSAGNIGIASKGTYLKAEDGFMFENHQRVATQEYVNGRGFLTGVNWADIGSRPNLIGSKLFSSYWGFVLPDGTDQGWLRTTEYGIIPFKNSGASKIGTPSWPFLEMHSKEYFEDGDKLSDRYLSKTGGTLTGDLNLTNQQIVWSENTDNAIIGFKNDSDSDANSYMYFRTGDNNNEYFRWLHKTADSELEWMSLKSDGLKVRGNVVSNSHIYGRSVNGEYSNLYRFGGLYLTWNSDTYGENDYHSIRSTYGQTPQDAITMNSYGHIRFNIDSNNNSNGSRFEIGSGTRGVGNVVFSVSEGGKVVSQNTIQSESNFRLTSGDGKAIRFWNDANDYAIYMSNVTNETFGGQVNGDTTSDYNMYFKMSKAPAGKSRGFVFRYENNNVAGIDGTGNGRFAGFITEQGVRLSNKYLGKTDKAASATNSDQLGGAKAKLGRPRRAAIWRKPG